VRRHGEPAGPIAVVAFGGNALVRAGERGSHAEQLRNAGRAAAVLTRLIRKGYELVLVHGNGPQVGLALIRADAASAKVPPAPLHLCVSETQGSMGFLLETALSNRLRAESIDKPVVTVLTRVVVDESDPAFAEPSKPVGPFFSAERARSLMREQGYRMVEDSGRGWRRVVSSPKPTQVIEIDVIRHLAREGHVVIAGGGGGIPVALDASGRFAGVEAVVDKDYVASLIARAVGARLFVILTEVSHVFLDFGTPRARKLARIDLIDAIDHYRDGQFPRGSMGPKIEATIDYLVNGGSEALITNASSLGRALEHRSGTFVVRSQGKGFIDLGPRPAPARARAGPAPAAATSRRRGRRSRASS
jgi:carbamate kinase